jgi:hypothetical protein
MNTLKDHHLFQALLELQLPADHFVVFGSGPLMAHGLRESRDLDLLARGAAWEVALSQGELDHFPDGNPRITLAGGDIEVMACWDHGEWSVDEVIETADLFHGIRFAQLQYTLAWKRRLNRPKDEADIQLIEAYLGQGA